MDCNPPGFSVHINSLGKNTGLGCHSLLQGIFLTQESNPGLLPCRQILYYLSPQGSPIFHKGLMCQKNCYLSSGFGRFLFHWLERPFSPGGPLSELGRRKTPTLSSLPSVASLHSPGRGNRFPIYVDPITSTRQCYGITKVLSHSRRRSV